MPLQPASLLANQRGKMGGATIGTFAGAALGAVLGTFVFPGVGTALGAQIGAVVGGTIGGIVEYATAADQVNRQESVAGLQVQTSAYGQPMPQIFDTYRVAGNIIFISPKKAHEHRTTAGGKGGPKQVSITKTYSVDIALALCDTLVTGPMTTINKAWADGTLLYSNAAGFPLPTGWAFYPGTDTQPIDPTISFWYPFGNTPRFIYTCYVVMADYDLGPYPRVPNFTFEVTQGERRLPAVVQALALAAGVGEAALALGMLPDRRVRYLIGGVQPVRGIMEQLMAAFRFYLRESGMQLEGRALGLGDVVAQVPETDLDAAERPGATQGLRIQRAESRLLPTQLSVTYTAPGRDYQAGTQLATIGTLETVESPRSVHTSVALDDADAKALAQENLDRLWIERTQYALDVGRRWASLEPGDRVTVTSRGQTHSLLLTEAHYGRPGLMQLQARGDSVPVLFVEGAAPAIGDFPEVVLAFLEATVATFLSLPAMDSNDQAPRFHVVYSYPADDWPGATLHRSRDGGASYDLVHAGTLEVIGGTALTVLPSAAAYVTDTTSTLQVHLDHGQIMSVTPEAFQGGANLALVGSELVQFREATLTAPGTYTLRHFWRGRRGTEWAVGTHVAGERFVWFDQAVYLIAVDLAERYVSRQYKCVTQGLDIVDATAQSYSAASENLNPWRLESTTSVRQTNNDWVFSWWGRSRFRGSWIDGSQSTKDDDVAGYRLWIFTDATYVTTVRTVDIPVSPEYQQPQAWLYTQALQIEDFGTVQSIVYWRIAQVGAYGLSRTQNLVAA